MLIVIRYSSFCRGVHANFYSGPPECHLCRGPFCLSLSLTKAKIPSQEIPFMSTSPAENIKVVLKPVKTAFTGQIMLLTVDESVEYEKLSKIFV